MWSPQQGCCMMESRSIQQHSSSCILDQVKYPSHLQGQPHGKQIRVIEPGCGKSMSHQSEILPAQKGPPLVNLPQLPPAHQVAKLDPGAPQSCEPKSSAWVQPLAVFGISPLPRHELDPHQQDLCLVGIQPQLICSRPTHYFLQTPLSPSPSVFLLCFHLRVYPASSSPPPPTPAPTFAP